MTPDPTARRRGPFALTLMLAMVVSTFPPWALGALAPLITDDLDLSRSEFGALTTVMFAVGAALSPWAGLVADAIGGRRLLAALFAIGAATLAAIAVAPTYALLLAASAAAGLPLALGNPATNRLVADHVPGGRRGVLMGVKQSGVQVGVFLAGALLPPAALAMSWRGAMVLAAAVAAAGATTAAVVPRERAAVPPSVSAAAHVPPERVIGWLAGYAFLMGAAGAVVGAYLPLYAHEGLGLSVPAAGLVAGVTGVVGVSARVAWGRAGDVASHVAPILAGLAGAAALSALLVLAAGAVGSWLVWVGAVAMGASGGAWNAVGMLAIVKELDASRTGRASGRVLLAFYGGYVVSPIAFGSSVDATGGYTAGWLAVAAAFGAAGAVAGSWARAHRAVTRA